MTRASPEAGAGRRIGWWKTSFGEEEIRLLRESVAAEHVSQGEVTARFEARFAQSLGVPYAVATTSGSVALLLALMERGVGRGDEVLIPNRTWIAAAHAALLLGARVVLVDVCPDVPLIDVSQIKERITPRTKAIIPTHLNGRAVDEEEVRRLAAEYGIAVIEDACQALYSKNRSGFLGTQSDLGAFSLGTTKLVATGQGGVVVTHDRETCARLRLLRTHGVVDHFTDRWCGMGFNFKFTDLQASFGLAQLDRAPMRIDHLKRIYARYAAALADLHFLTMIPVDVANGEIPLYVEVLCPRRAEIMAHLERHGIQTRPSLPDLCSSTYLGSTGKFPRSRRFAEEGLYLPGGPEQTLENVEQVIEALREFQA